MNGFAYANNSAITFADPDGNEPADGNSLAHDTAVLLRVAELNRMYGGKAIVTYNIGGKSGPDLVCWNCAQLRGAKPGTEEDQVWVWEVKARGEVYAGGSGSSGVYKAQKDLPNHLRQAENDYLAEGRTAVPGMPFPAPSGPAVVLGRPDQLVTVESAAWGVEVYDVDEGNAIAVPTDAEYAASLEAAGVAARLLKIAQALRAALKKLYGNEPPPKREYAPGQRRDPGEVHQDFLADFALALGIVFGARFGFGLVIWAARNAGSRNQQPYSPVKEAEDLCRNARAGSFC
jgi:hypothetical protein